MIGLGTIANVIAIIAGSLAGMIIGKKISKGVHDILVKGLGLFTIAIGLRMFIETQHLLVVLFAILIGGAIGELIKIENRLENFGERIKLTIGIDHHGFLDGFMTASLIYCIGPIAILGSISDGVGGNHELLYIKSILDGTASIGFAAALGIGVIFSSIPVLIYQGILTAAAMLVGDLFSEAMIVELTAAGGMLMMGIGINLLGAFGEKGRIPVGNLLPAIALAPVLTWLITYLKVGL